MKHIIYIISLAITFFIMPTIVHAKQRPIQQINLSQDLSLKDHVCLILKRLMRYVPDDAFLIAIYLDDVPAYLKSIEGYFKDIIVSELYNAQAKQLAHEGLVLLLK